VFVIDALPDEALMGKGIVGIAIFLVAIVTGSVLVLWSIQGPLRNLLYIEIAALTSYTLLVVWFSWLLKWKDRTLYILLLLGVVALVVAETKFL